MYGYNALHQFISQRKGYCRWSFSVWRTECLYNLLCWKHKRFAHINLQEEKIIGIGHSELQAPHRYCTEYTERAGVDTSGEEIFHLCPNNQPLSKGSEPTRGYWSHHRQIATCIWVWNSLPAIFLVNLHPLSNSKRPGHIGLHPLQHAHCNPSKTSLLASETPC